jgi:hypothetical protein
VTRFREREDEGLRTLSGPDLLVDLSRLRTHLSGDLQVIADALAYCIVGIDHLILHAHDDEKPGN